jgi:hypothetical protein
MRSVFKLDKDIIILPASARSTSTKTSTAKTSTKATATKTAATETSVTRKTGTYTFLKLIK